MEDLEKKLDILLRDEYPEFIEGTSYEYLLEQTIIVVVANWSLRERVFQLLSKASLLAGDLDFLATTVLHVSAEETDFSQPTTELINRLRVVMVCENFTEFFKTPLLSSSLIIIRGKLNYSLFSREMKKTGHLVSEFACVLDEDFYTARHRLPFQEDRMLTEKIPKEIIEESLDSRTMLTHHNTFYYWKHLRHLAQAVSRQREKDA